MHEKVAVITGASRGIGAAIARAAAESGWAVALASRKQQDLDAIAEQIRSGGGKAIAVACHTGKAEEVDELFAKTIEAFGRVDAVCNNAATNPHFGPLLECSDTAFDKTVEVNVKGYLNVVRSFVNALPKTAPKGSVVNIASIAGLGAAPMQGAYGITKAAVLSMTKTLAVELAPRNIRVNAIAPGLVETRFASAIVENPALRDMLVKRTPLARHAQPEEISAAALYLMSDASSFATGSTLVVDGGFTIS